jgi:hypothetical protein
MQNQTMPQQITISTMKETSKKMEDHGKDRDMRLKII